MSATRDVKRLFETSGASSIPPVQLLDAIVDAVIVTDPKGSIIYWNDEARALYGWSAIETMGRNIAAFVPTEHADVGSKEKLEGHLAGNKWQGEFVIRRRDGSSFTALLKSSPILSDDGTLNAVIIVANDVSENRSLTTRLATSESEARALIENSGDLVAVADADGVIRVLAGPVEAVVGVPPHVMVGTSLFALLRQADVSRAQSLWAKRSQTTVPLTAEDFWIQRVDGTWVCLSVLANNCLDDPAIGGIVVTLRDVTERKNLESARKVIRDATSALVRGGSEAELFDEICRVIVADEGFELAWIGVLDATRPLGVRVMAVSGSSWEYLEALQRVAATGAMRGPLAIALETNEFFVIQDIKAQPATDRWRQLALDYGHRSLIALPLSFGVGNVGALVIYAAHTYAFSDKAIAVLRELADDVAYGVRAIRDRTGRIEYQTRFAASLEATVRAISAASEMRDPYTAGHQRRVAELAVAIARDLEIDADLATGIGVAASIHDIGKMVVPTEILSKPGPLTDIEFAIVKEHAQAGYDIVSGIDFPWPAAEMILQHHERLDGSGYPASLRDREIVIGARIMAVADVVEAMTSHRPYRAAPGFDAALIEISTGSGTLYDPDVVDACKRLFQEQRFQFT